MSTEYEGLQAEDSSRIENPDPEIMIEYAKVVEASLKGLVPCNSKL